MSRSTAQKHFLHARFPFDHSCRNRGLLLSFFARLGVSQLIVPGQYLGQLSLDIVAHLAISVALSRSALAAASCELDAKGGSAGCFDPNRSRAPTAIASLHQFAARRRTRSAPKKGRKLQDNQNSFTPWPSERICGQSWWP